MSDSTRYDEGDRASSARRLSRRKWLSLAGAGGIAALAGCDGGDGGDDTPTEGNGETDDTEGTTTGGTGEVVTIEYWRWPHSTEPSNTGEDEIVQAFNEGPGAEQGIEVETVTNPFGDHRSAVQTAVGGGDAPDVAWTFTPRIFDPAGMSRSEIEEEAPFVYIEDYADDEWLNDFYERPLNLQRNQFDGVVGAPFVSALTPGLMYLNVDAWNEAGLGEIPTGNWSYEEYLDAVEQIHGTNVNGTTINGVGIGLNDAPSGEWINYPGNISRTAGSVIGNGYQNQDDEYVLTMASDPEVEAWNNLFGIPIENGWTNNPLAYDFLEQQEPFTAGQIGLLHHTTFSRVQFGQEADFEWEIIPYPTRGGNEGYSVYIAGQSIIISMVAFKDEVGGNPEEAAEFIKFRNNAQNQYNWFNTSSQTVPNEGAYELMESEGVSDFVEQTGGKAIMDRVDEGMEQYSDLEAAIQERYPDIKLNASDSPVTGVPSDIAGGRVNQLIGNMLQRLAQNNNANPQEAYTNTEEEWVGHLEDADGVAVDQSSVGYNQPEPQAGPL